MTEKHGWSDWIESLRCPYCESDDVIGFVDEACLECKNCGKIDCV